MRKEGPAMAKETKLIKGLLSQPKIGESAVIVGRDEKIYRMSPIEDIMYGSSGMALVTRNSIYYLDQSVLSLIQTEQ